MGNTLVADGDSITFGYQVSGPNFPYAPLLTLNGGTCFRADVAVSGETLATMLANAPADVDPFYAPAGGGNVVVLWGGTNDIINGATSSATYANLVSYVAARHAVGWKVVVCTMLSRTTLDSQKNAYNALILANTAGADAIVDFTQTPLGIDGGYSNTTYFQDGTHPTEFAISTIEAPLISAAVNSLNIESTSSISLVQATSGTVSGSAGSAAAAYASSVSKGDLLIVSITPISSGTTVSALSDSLGSSWTLAKHSSVAEVNSYVYWAIAGGSGTDTLTATLSGDSANVIFMMAEFAGVSTLDVAAISTQGYAGSPLSISSTSTSKPIELVVTTGDFYYGNPSTPSGYSRMTGYGNGTVGFHSMAYSITSSKGAQSASWTWTGGSSYSLATIETFLGPTGIPNSLMQQGAGA